MTSAKPTTKKRASGKERTWAGKFDRQVGFLLRKAYQRNMVIFQQHTPVPQLTSMQAATLMVLLDESPCSLTTLGRAAAMDPATTRGVVERLHERELVSLVSDSKDKRKVMVQLVKRGQQLAQDMVPILTRIADETTKSLNDAERIALTYLLEKIANGDDETKEK
jgi:DNA-binding MarR family transcriptional regulator